MYRHLLKFFLLSIISTWTSIGSVPTSDDEEIAMLLNEMNFTIGQRYAHFEQEIIPLEKELLDIQEQLSKTHSLQRKVNFILEKDALQEQIKELTLRYESDISKIRYLKGLQIIKILYEKTLDLDHHFAAVSTLSEINRLTNPNEYAAFRDIKTKLTEKTDKKSGFDLSSLLGNNIYTSVIHSFVALFNSSATSREQKQHNLQEVECILDFTLRMHNDLNTIYFETSYLRNGNKAVMEDLQVLFKMYTSPISYTVPLKTCRENDEWSIIRNHLNDYIDRMNQIIEHDQADRNFRNMQINLQFPIDRLLQFITKYNAFIDQGSKFYEKFRVMLNSYENEERCANNIPEDYREMKANIYRSIEKFNTAYRPVEINGSKLKQLLYGINEYE
ncbi:MAG: hypothetical protein R3359_04450 [Marinirhabdus sp.]|nr:hypothetical protein [Marinirhabdus sp.]